MLLALGAAGCGGGHRATSPSPPASPRAAYVVIYGAGQPARTRTGVHAVCPPGATCRVRKLTHVTPREWQLAVTRTLRCGPAAGQYTHPARACRALDEFRTLLAHRHSACRCPAYLGIQAVAIGRVGESKVTVPLDSCTLCGLGAKARTDAGILVPA